MEGGRDVWVQVWGAGKGGLVLGRSKKTRHANKTGNDTKKKGTTASWGK